MKLFFVIVMLCCGLVSLAQEGILKEGTYPNGKIRYRGYFVNGQPDGKVTYYYPDGKVKAEMNHKGAEADAVLFSKNGEITTSGKYVSQQKEGEWLYKRGTRVIQKEYYKQNKPEGVSVRYNAAGQVVEKKNWKNGRLDGEWKIFYDNGKTRFESHYVDGKLNGAITSFNYDGKKITEGTYKDDLKEGAWRYYDDKGTLVKERHYKAGISDHQQDDDREENKEIDQILKEGQKIVDPARFVNEPENYMRITE